MTSVIRAARTFNAMARAAVSSTEKIKPVMSKRTMRHPGRNTCSGSWPTITLRRPRRAAPQRLPRTITGTSTKPHTKGEYWTPASRSAPNNATPLANETRTNEITTAAAIDHRHTPRSKPHCLLVWATAVSRTTRVGKPNCAGTASNDTNANT